MPPSSDDEARVGAESGAEEAKDEPHIAVRVTRSGGVAGITRRWQAEAPAGDESHWVAVIEECPWNATPPTDLRADGFMWRIVAVIRHDERSVVLPESAVVGPWATLIRVVRDASVEPGV